MSDDELEKLAAEMKNIHPSEHSRKQGMDAAMAAFDMEFAAEAAEEISNTPQGLEASPRPTGQTTAIGAVQTLGRDTMSKLSEIFSFKPKTAMMMGSCAVALFATSLYFPNTTFEEIATKPAPEAVTVERDEIVVTGKKATETHPIEQEASSEVQIVEIAPAPAPAPLTAPKTPAADKAASADDATVKAQGGVNSISDLLDKVRTDSAQTEAENRDREAKFRQRRDQQMRLLAPMNAESQKAIAEYRAALQQTDNTALFAETRTANGYVNDPSVPTVTKEVSRRVVKTPARTVERSIPAITKTETRRVKKADGTYMTVTVPVVVQEAGTELVTIPPTYETITETIRVPAQDKFERVEFNPTSSVDETPVSTFSVDVDTASYSFLRASINRGQLPPPSAIRLEEMINYFPYNYEAPTSADEPFKANVTVTSNPWNADTKLMHVGIKGYVPPADERPRSNIVFLIDTSGSMNAPNKLPLLINSFKLLLNTLDGDDTVSIVTYAGRAGTVLEPTAASDKHKIKSALDRLRSGGSTAGAAGLELAYNKAQESFDKEGINRVILATDGDFNVGFSSPDEMKSFVEKKRKTGIFLSVLGFGMGNYNDHLMQSLAQNGNGVAAYIDNLAEANKVLANEAGSALITIAKDVKIQVEFNPATVSEYRLIGYETRALKREDFNNDKVDAGEIGAGHSVTAIYEMTPVGSPARTIDKLRYVLDRAEQEVSEADEYAFVKIRHKLPNADTSTLQTFPIGKGEERNLKRASDDMRFATAVAAVGQKLRGDTQLEDFSYDEVIKLASGARGEDEHGYRAEFIQLVRLMESLEE